MRAEYDDAVEAAVNPRIDDEVRRTGVALTRAQHQFNRELASSRRLAARFGVPMGVASRNPTTTPEYLGLILRQQRQLVSVQERIASSLEAIAKSVDSLSRAAPDLVSSLLYRIRFAVLTPL